jgi:hypothetical protein
MKASRPDFPRSPSALDQLYPIFSLSPDRPKPSASLRSSKKARQSKTSSLFSEKLEAFKQNNIELSSEIQMWNQTWIRLVAMLTNVVPFPSLFPQSPDHQRMLLEQLCAQVCQSAISPMQKLPLQCDWSISVHTYNIITVP